MRIILLFSLIFLSFSSFAQTGDLELFKVATDGDSQTYTANIKTLIFMTMLSFGTAAIVMLTPFMRCLIVFGLLRQALGTMHSPPNQVVIAIALMISFIVLQPTLQNMYDNIYVPYENGELTSEEGVEKAVLEMKSFWLSATKEEELIYFSELMQAEPVDDYMDIPLNVLLPAFVYSEIKLAFKIGFLIFLPFLIIDIIVASTLMGMGMMMLSPMIVSLPIKIVAFVVLDGWGLLTTSLIASYGVV